MGRKPRTVKYIQLGEKQSGKFYKSEEIVLGTFLRRLNKSLYKSAKLDCDIAKEAFEVACKRLTWFDKTFKTAKYKDAQAKKELFFDALCRLDTVIYTIEDVGTIMTQIIDNDKPGVNK